MVYFLGYMLGSLCLPRLADSHGRKWVFLGAMMTCFSVQLTLLLLPKGNINVVYFMISLMFVTGLQSSVRSPVGFCYFVELAHSRYSVVMLTGWATMEASVYMVCTIYYQNFGKNWEVTMMYAVFLQSLVII